MMIITMMTVSLWSWPVHLAVLQSGMCTAAPPSIHFQLPAGIPVRVPQTLNLKPPPPPPGAAVPCAGYDSKEKAEADGTGKKMADIGRYHVLPPLPVTEAVWTTPFMSNVSMTSLMVYSTGGLTLNIGASVNAPRRGTYDQVHLSSPGTPTSTVTHPDIYACKGFVNVIDTVLLPNK